MADFKNLWVLAALFVVLAFASGQVGTQAGFDFGQVWNGLSGSKQQLLIFGGLAFAVIIFLAMQFDK